MLGAANEPDFGRVEIDHDCLDGFLIDNERSEYSGPDSIVMAGLVPAIHASMPQFPLPASLLFTEKSQQPVLANSAENPRPSAAPKCVDGRDKPGHDG
jgi:hypothetical protein